MQLGLGLGLRQGFRFARSLHGLPLPRRLNDIVKLEFLKNESSSRIREIWLSYHSNKDFVVGDVWSPTDFTSFFEASKRAGENFIFPVTRENGYFIILSQIQSKQILFTYLEDYKRDPRNAQPYLTINFYDDLSIDNGLILVRGEITPGALNRLESSRLLRLIRHFYLENEQDVTAFSKGALDFERHVSGVMAMDK